MATRVSGRRSSRKAAPGRRERPPASGARSVWVKPSQDTQDRGGRALTLCGTKPVDVRGGSTTVKCLCAQCKRKKFLAQNGGGWGGGQPGDTKALVFAGASLSLRDLNYVTCTAEVWDNPVEVLTSSLQKRKSSQGVPFC